MKIKGKVHCLFEQSGTFKNEFRKLGYEAEDYDIQNNSKLKGNTAGLCSEERSMISPDYARNFICDNILGKPQRGSQLMLFEGTS